jgi:hypothetical protein
VRGGGPGVSLGDGRFVVAGTDRAVAWSQVARAAYQPRQRPPGLEPGFSPTAATARARCSPDP